MLKCVVYQRKIDIMEFSSRVNETITEHATLVLATVSVGNVGQIACELLLANYEHTLTGFLYDPNVLPSFGHDPLSDGTSAMSLELYSIKDASAPTYILQQRAPAQVGRQRAFAHNLASWIEKSHFANIVILTSIESQSAKDFQLKGHRCCYIDCQYEQVSVCDALNLQSLTSQSDVDLEDLMSRALPPWPLLTECRRRNLTAWALLSFVTEGDNVPDGIEQASIVRRLLELPERKSARLPLAFTDTYALGQQQI